MESGPWTVQSKKMADHKPAFTIHDPPSTSGKEPMRAAYVLLVSLLATAAAAAGRSEPRPSPVGPRGSALKIGMVDVSRAFAGYRRVADLERETVERFRQPFDELRQRLQKMKEREEEFRLSPFAKDSPQHRKAQEKLAAAIKKYRQDRNALESKYKVHLYQQEGRLTADLLEAIRLHGQEEGFDFIFKKDTGQRSGAPADPSRILRVNPVLYHSDAVDVTDAVAKRLNEAYARGERLGEALLRRLARPRENPRAGGTAPARPAPPEKTGAAPARTPQAGKE